MMTNQSSLSLVSSVVRGTTLLPDRRTFHSTSFAGSLIFPPHRGGKMRDPGNEVPFHFVLSLETSEHQLRLTILFRFIILACLCATTFMVSDFSNTSDFLYLTIYKEIESGFSLLSLPSHDKFSRAYEFCAHFFRFFARWEKTALPTQTSQDSSSINKLIPLYACYVHLRKVNPLFCYCSLDSIHECSGQMDGSLAAKNKTFNIF